MNSYLNGGGNDRRRHGVIARIRRWRKTPRTITNELAFGIIWVLILGFAAGTSSALYYADRQRHIACEDVNVRRGELEQVGYRLVDLHRRTWELIEESLPSGVIPPVLRVPMFEQFDEVDEDIRDSYERTNCPKPSIWPW